MSEEADQPTVLPLTSDEILAGAAKLVNALEPAQTMGEVRRIVFEHYAVLAFVLFDRMADELKPELAEGLKAWWNDELRKRGGAFTLQDLAREVPTPVKILKLTEGDPEEPTRERMTMIEAATTLNKSRKTLDEHLRQAADKLKLTGGVPELRWIYRAAARLPEEDDDT